MTEHRCLSGAKGRKRLSIQHHLYHIRQIFDMAIYASLMDADRSKIPRNKLRGIFDRKKFDLFFDSRANSAASDGEFARCCGSTRTGGRTAAF